ncbi:hypothetical protein ACNKHP_21275 [Shigella boydii]
MAKMRLEYDESGRLIQETAPDGDITRYRLRILAQHLPYAMEDATGSPENHDAEPIWPSC